MTDDILGAARDLAPISLAELMGLADLQTRRDRKYLVPRPVAEEILAAAASPGTRVLLIDDVTAFRYESVYFDTADLASYLGAARRRPRRFKVRTRTYLDSASCVLEVKVRDHRGRTVKHRFPYAVENRRQLTDAARTVVGGIEQAADAAEHLDTSLTTSYRRTSLLLPCATTRVTVDVDLEWAHPGGACAALPGHALIESKSPGPPSAIDRALWRAGHRPLTISKYCTGLAAVAPDLPANKWNRTLRRHFDRTPRVPV